MNQTIINIIINRQEFNILYNLLETPTRTLVYVLATGILTAGKKWKEEEIASLCDLKIEEVNTSLEEAQNILNNDYYQAKYFGR